MPKPPHAQFVLRPVGTPSAPLQAAAGPLPSYHLGLTLFAMGEYEAARETLRGASAIGPDRRAASQKLKALHTWGGGAASAGPAINMPADARSGPPKALSAARMDRAEREVRAEIAGKPAQLADLLLRNRLRNSPTDAAALRVLADLVAQQLLHADAERLLERVLELAPNYSGARHAYALALFRQGKEARAIPHVEMLLGQNPRELSYRILLASCHAAVGHAERAITLYEAALRDAPRRPDLIHSYAQALKIAGRREDSMRALRTCIEIAPDSGQAYWNIINIAKTPPAQADLDAMRAQLEGAHLSPEKRFHFHYALGQALEKLKDFAGSFQHYAAGAKLQHGIVDYRPDGLTSEVRRRMKLFSAAFFAERRGCGNPDAAPIFILGMPRAGSTLVEQVLASHSLVEGTQELPEIWHIVSELDDMAKGGFASSYPECVLKFAKPDFAALGRRYLEFASAYRKTDRRFFVDKMPSNWIETGFIHAILPNARIIDARRDPMANGFAAFSMYFSQGMEFSYDLRDIGSYYNDYLMLMEHFDSVLPGRVHRVVYENLVNDTETEIRRLLDYCGLPFEADCLRFWENKRVVTTASAEQVRRPIFREGLDHWRNYEPWLEPLRQALNARKAGE